MGARAGYVAICRRHLSHVENLDPDDLALRLHKCIHKQYEDWKAKELQAATEDGEVEDQIDPPRDVVSYLLDHELPVALMRAGSSGKTRNSELQQLVRELDDFSFFSLLLVYADTIDDLEGCRSARATLCSKPYQSMIQGFRDRSMGGKERQSSVVSENRARDDLIHQRAVELRNEGKPARNIAGILAKTFKLSPRHIRRILRKMDTT